eukprot:scaffold109043_cov19-Tisochrysis_lutea.AAC.5
MQSVHSNHAFPNCVTAFLEPTESDGFPRSPRACSPSTNAPYDLPSAKTSLATNDHTTDLTAFLHSGQEPGCHQRPHHSRPHARARCKVSSAAAACEVLISCL